LHAGVSICGLTEGLFTVYCAAVEENKDWSNARLEVPTRESIALFHAREILSITRLQPGLRLTAIKNPSRYFLAAPTSKYPDP